MKTKKAKTSKPRDRRKIDLTTTQAMAVAIHHGPCVDGVRWMLANADKSMEELFHLETPYLAWFASTQTCSNIPNADGGSATRRCGRFSWRRSNTGMSTICSGMPTSPGLGPDGRQQ